MFYLNIIYSRDHSKYYGGSSKDPWERLAVHNGSPRNTFTSKYRPWQLAAVFEAGPFTFGCRTYGTFRKKAEEPKFVGKVDCP
ncbi:MAG: GIY-YIG nuclease family protein [Bacteroidota bacterium]